MAIKFFFSSGACSLCPHILLHEVGAAFEPIQIAREGAQVNFPADFERINSKMRVPVIVIDDQVITELPAVVTIIAGMAPEQHLMGRTPMETARVYEWLNYLSGTLHTSGFGHFLRPQRWTTATDDVSVQAVKTRAWENILDCFQYIESRLEGVHAVGDSITPVDFFLYVCYRWGKKHGGDMKTYPKYTELARSVEARETVQLALEKEGLAKVL